MSLEAAGYLIIGLGSLLIMLLLMWWKSSGRD